MRIILFIILSLSFIFPAHSGTSRIDTLTYKAFSKVYVFTPSQPLQSVVLFVAGDEGWTPAMTGMCEQISEQGSMVAGFDQKKFYSKTIIEKPGCYYPAGDLEMLSEFLQKKYHIKEYKKPILIGWGSGATLAYGALAQAPASTFKALISMNFNPRIKLNKPYCDGDGLKSHKLKSKNSWYFEPCGNLSAPFITLQGEQSKTFTAQDAQKFVNSTGNAELVSVPFNPGKFPARWMPYLLKAFQKIRQVDQESNPILTNVQLPKDLPVKAIPSFKDTLPLLVFISGDGGWTSFDQSVSEEFSKKGIPVIGIDAQKYFWEKKTQEQATSDISKAITFYLHQYNRKSFILMGYSFGASLIPFITNRFSQPLRNLQTSMVAISPDEKADFEIHVADMLNFGSSVNNLDVVSEIRNVKGIRKICIFGSEESENLRKKFTMAGNEVLTLSGNHHFNNDYQALVNMIVKVAF